MSTKPTIYSTLTITSSQVFPTSGYARALIDATAGNITVTVPAVSNFYLFYGVMFSRKDTTTNVVTVSVPDGVNGYTSIILSAGESVQIVADYTTWYFSNGYVNEIVGSRDLAVTSASPRGMLAYNTNVVFGAVGLYYSNGSMWIKLDTGSTSSVVTSSPLTGDGSSMADAVTFADGTMANQIWKWDSGSSTWVASTVPDEITTSGFITGDGALATPIKLVDGTAIGQIPQWSGLAWFSRNPLVGSTLYVNTLGDDATGQANNPMRAYATLDAAIAAAAALPSGDLKFIRVSPGVYAASANFAIANTSYYFDPGCTVNHSGDVLSPAANIASTSITGYAEIVCTRLINFTAFRVATCQIAANSITCSTQLLAATGIPSSNKLKIYVDTLSVVTTSTPVYDGDGTLEITANTIVSTLSLGQFLIQFSNSTSLVFILNVVTMSYDNQQIYSDSTVSNARIYITIYSVTSSAGLHLIIVDSPSTTLIANIAYSDKVLYNLFTNSGGSIASFNIGYATTATSVTCNSASTITVNAIYMENTSIQLSTDAVYSLNVGTFLASGLTSIITSNPGQFQLTININTLIVSSGTDIFDLAGTSGATVINIRNLVHSSSDNVFRIVGGTAVLTINYIKSVSGTSSPIIYMDQTAVVTMNLLSADITGGDPIRIGTTGVANTVKASILLGAINVTPTTFVMALYGTSTTLVYVRGRIRWNGSGGGVCIYIETTNIAFDNCVFVDVGTDPTSITALNPGTVVRFYGTFTSNRALNPTIVPSIGTVTIDSTVI